MWAEETTFPLASKAAHQSPAKPVTPSVRTKPLSRTVRPWKPANGISWS
jgi:hypothetical protein